jgi:hypothetical protein
MSDDASTKVRDEARQLVKACLAANPVIILGSGASADLGLPTMKDLAERIIADVSGLKLSPEENKKWAVISAALQAGEGLEPALDKASLDEASPLFKSIVDSVWKAVAWQDVMAFEKVRAGRVLPHTKLFKYLFGGSTRSVNVITPNYDRLAEYGADQGGFCHRTGFMGGYYRMWQGPSHTPRYLRGDIRQENRTINVLKVHGSVDWFREEVDKDPVCLPVYATAEVNLQMPNGMRPVIVPPANLKYRQSQFDPYRSLMTEADRALQSAEAFLCIGYGFNDEHIQPYLKRAMRDRPKPFVMATMSLTEKTREALKQASKSLEYCVLTAGDKEGTMIVRTHEYPDGEQIEGIEAWSFDGFANEYL